MMARRSVLAVLAAVGLVLAGAAAAKGPSAARIDGPGLAAPLVLRGWGESGTGALGALTMDGGFFATTFGQVPDVRLPGRPQGDLGPRYTVDYTVPAGETSPSHLLQDIYPYARGGPVLHLAPDQVMFDGGSATVGGWMRGPETLLSTLVSAGLPATPPDARSGRLGGGAVLAGTAVALLVLCGGALALVVRRNGATPQSARGRNASSA
jgi:hypothetical protein